MAALAVDSSETVAVVLLDEELELADEDELPEELLEPELLEPELLVEPDEPELLVELPVEVLVELV